MNKTLDTEPLVNLNMHKVIHDLLEFTPANKPVIWAIAAHQTELMRDTASLIELTAKVQAFIDAYPRSKADD